MFAPRPTVSSKAALDSFAVQAQQKGLEIAAVIDPEVPRWVRGDPSRFRQVVLNLVGNALKFTSVGYSIEVSLAQPKTEAGYRRRRCCRLQPITDTGVGIPDKARQLLFGKFIQADTSISRRYGGTGLGLAISKQLVTLMGGTIEVESAVGEGTTFRFTVRYARAQTEPDSRDTCDRRTRSAERAAGSSWLTIPRSTAGPSPGQLEAYGIIATTMAITNPAT